jgi:hypothetical protein
MRIQLEGSTAWSWTVAISSRRPARNRRRSQPSCALPRRQRAAASPSSPADSNHPVAGSGIAVVPPSSGGIAKRAKALGELQKVCNFVKVLGSYPNAE